MKNYLTAALAASLLASPSLLLADSAFKTDQEKISYSIGVDIGKNLHQQGIEIAPDILAQGVKDAGGNGADAMKMTEAEMKETMTAFMQTMRTKMMAKQHAQATDNKAAGDKYLDANKKKDGWKTTASGLQYKIITTGTGDKPKATDTVVTQYRGTKIDGTEFDSSYKRNEPAEFPVNAVIPGWTEALQMMPVGSKWQLVIPANLAYGENAPPQIGANSVLLFDVELVGIKKGDTAPAAAAPAPAK